MLGKKIVKIVADVSTQKVNTNESIEKAVYPHLLPPWQMWQICKWARWIPNVNIHVLSGPPVADQNVALIAVTNK